MATRFHLSKKKIQTFYNTTNQSQSSSKPTGFWYSIDTMFDKTNGLTFNINSTDHCCYIYKLDIPEKYYTKSLNDKNKILILNTINRINRFIDKYRYKNAIILKKGDKPAAELAINCPENSSITTSLGSLSEVVFIYL